MTDKLKELNVLDILDKYKEINVANLIGSVTTMKQIKLKLTSTVDSFLADINLKEMLNIVKEHYKEFDIECRNILNIESINIEESKDTMRDLYTKIYSLSAFKVTFQNYYNTLSIIISTLKIIQNSFKSYITSLPDDFIKASDGTPIKTVSGRQSIIDATFTDIESYVSTLEETQKKHTLSLLYRCSDLIDIILKQEKSIRAVYEGERFDRELNRKLSMEQSL